MDLLFVRHGIAVEREEWRGGDAERPLTEEGSRRMSREAKALASLGLRPSAIVTSPLVRARQTAEIIASGLGLTSALAEEPRLAPGFDMGDFADILAAHSKAELLILVGHEPDFSIVIGRLIGGGRVECKKGGVARVRIDDPKTPRGTLLWLAPPKLWEGALIERG